jgi:hypothetical protein
MSANAEMTNNLYPVTVFMARYGGTYEGAPWIAVQARNNSELLHGSQGGDISCFEWFNARRVHNIPTGRGNTPDQAVADLAQQLGIDWTPGDDSLTARFAKALKEAEAEKIPE